MRVTVYVACVFHGQHQLVHKPLPWQLVPTTLLSGIVHRRDSVTFGQPKLLLPRFSIKHSGLCESMQVFSFPVLFSATPPGQGGLVSLGGPDSEQHVMRHKAYDEHCPVPPVGLPQLTLDVCGLLQETSERGTWQTAAWPGSK
jgi:hypothetical protein